MVQLSCSSNKNLDDFLCEQLQVCPEQLIEECIAGGCWWAY